MPLSVGARLGRYQVTAWIGKGGMGEVWAAVDTDLERPVAIKVLLAEALEDPIRRKRFEREAKSAAALNHPNICTIHEVSAHHGEPYIVMEHVDGKPLKEIIGRSGMPIDRVVAIGTQVASALAHAHAKGIVHRDLTHANVVVTSSGVAKVLDFGLAKRYQAPDVGDVTRSHPAADERLTEERTVAGTPAYLAPELLVGKAGSTASDVWALGVLLHRMVSGQAPFTGVTVEELTGAILHKEPRELPSDTPAALQVVIARCLDKNPHQRFRRGSDVHRALTAVDRALLKATEAATVVGVEAGEWARHEPQASSSGPTPMQSDRMATDPETLQRLTRGLETFTSVATVAGTVLTLGLVVLFLGFVTSMTFDLALRAPSQSTPLDYLAMGARALIPILFWAVIALAVGLIVFAASVVGRWVLRRLPGGESVVAPVERVADRIRAAVREADARDKAVSYLVLACVLLLLLISVSWELLSTITALVESASGAFVDTSRLGADYEAYQNLCAQLGAVVILLLSIGWVVVFGSPFAGPTSRVKVARSLKLAGFATIVLAAAVTTVPWRLLWNNHSEPATYNGQPAYIVQEADDRLFLWIKEPPGGRAIAVPQTDPGLNRSLTGAPERIFDVSAPETS